MNQAHLLAQFKKMQAEMLKICTKCLL